MFSFKEHLLEAKRRVVKDLVVETLTSDELNEKISSRKLNFKDIHYWFGIPWKSPESYTWIVSSTSKGEVVGFAEFQFNPYNKNEVWLKNISTKVKYQNRGVATGMIPSIVEAAKKMKKIVVRSKPSDSGLAYTNDKITAAFDAANVKWKRDE
jgi:RimJ/RimL family protein N-acetyltransferase